MNLFREALNEKSRQGIEEQRMADQDLQVRGARQRLAVDVRPLLRTVATTSPI